MFYYNYTPPVKCFWEWYKINQDRQLGRKKSETSRATTNDPSLIEGAQDEGDWYSEVLTVITRSKATKQSPIKPWEKSDNIKEQIFDAYYVYILTNQNHTVLYTGVTSDLYQRIQEHSLKV